MPKSRRVPSCETCGSTDRTLYASIDGSTGYRCAEHQESGRVQARVEARCEACEGLIEWLDPGNDIGGWWVHEHHPEDGHDAHPARLAKDHGGLWRGFCNCGWHSPLLTKTKATTARRQHRADVHPATTPARMQSEEI